MPLDPKQLFVVNAICRAGIASELSGTRECCGYKHPIGPQEIAEDDDRLTDEICQAYADAIGEIDYSDSEEFTSDVEQNAICEALEAMGYIQCDSDDDELRRILQDEIKAYETILATKREALAMLGD